MKKPPTGTCDIANDSLCCIQGKLYATYQCSLPVSQRTKAVLMLYSFEKGADGGAPSRCHNMYHLDNTLVVALSTHQRRCLNNITIYGNGRSVKAMVVDKCDSAMGCDADHDCQPPCPKNIIESSRAVWEGLAVPLSQWGELDIFWSDA